MVIKFDGVSKTLERESQKTINFYQEWLKDLKTCPMV